MLFMLENAIFNKNIFSFITIKSKRLDFMQDRILRRILLLAGIVLLVWVLYLLKPVVIPFIGAFFLAYLFSPLVDVLVKIKLPRWLAISVVFIGIGVTLTIALWYLVPLIWKQLVYARDSIPAGIHWINAELLPWVSSTFNVQQMEIDTDQMSKAVMDYVQTNYSADSIQAVLLKLAQSGLNFIQIGGTVVLIPIIAFYFFIRLGPYATKLTPSHSTPI